MISLHSVLSAEPGKKNAFKDCLTLCNNENAYITLIIEAPEKEANSEATRNWKNKGIRFS